MHFFLFTCMGVTSEIECMEGMRVVPCRMQWQGHVEQHASQNAQQHAGTQQAACSPVRSSHRSSLHQLKARSVYMPCVALLAPWHPTQKVNACGNICLGILFKS